MDLKRFRRPVGPVLSLLFVFVLSGAVTLLVLWMHPVSTKAMLLNMLRLQPHLLVLNYLPIFLLVLAFAFLFRNAFYSAALVGFVTAGMSIANRLKIQIRDEPLVPRDFGLLKEAADAAGSYDLHLPWTLIACVVFFSLVCVVLGYLLPTRRRESGTSVRVWLVRLGGFAASWAVLACAVTFGYSSTDLYNSFAVSNPYYLPAVCNDLGFPYFFCYHFSTYQLAKPEGFDRQTAESWETGDQTAEDAPEVNVIFVMNEAFSDLTNYDVFTYSEEDDPLKTFNALCESENALSGHIVVPGFAGGTANTEFDVLTGMQTNALNPAATSASAFRCVNRDLDSVFRLFTDEGYHTTFLHPGDAWFYNRENVYQWLGAQDILFAEDFQDSQSKGRWVTDETVARNLIDRYEDSMAAGTPVMDYAVTIQNHMSYTVDKYGEGYVFPPVETDATLSEEASTLLSVYIEGVRDADAMLKTLTDYFDQRSEPVVLVFFGDHLPYLGDDRLVYRELGLPIGDESGAEDPFCAYETPFLIWCNDAGAEAVDLSAARESLELPESGRISACFLGATVLELTGRGDVSPWFSFLNQLRRELPVVQNGLYETLDGAVLTQLPQELSQQVDQWRQWSYYKLKYKTVE